MLSRWLHRPADRLIGLRIDEIICSPSRASLLEALRQAASGDDVDATISVKLHRDSRVIRDTAMRIARVMVGGQTLLGVIFQRASGSAVDAPADARRDPLTGLPDRNFLISRLATLLEGDRAADRQFAVLFLDLNNFKQINDSHGHLFGDRVLRSVAGRLSECVREGDHVTRFGGDEFVVLLEGVTKPDEISPVVARIHDALASPIVLPEGEFSLSLSIGVAQSAPHHRTADDVLSDADREMYAAKRAAT
jgi:diguanylate cyclase (GGDEF)-like protein